MIEMETEWFLSSWAYGGSNLEVIIFIILYLFIFIYIGFIRWKG